MTAAATQAAIQAAIAAQQSLDTIEYGLRSVKVCGGAYRCTGPHAGQLSAACAEAGAVLGQAGAVQLDNGTEFLLRRAKAEARLTLDAAKAERKAIGGIRQQRLALAVAA